MPNKLELIGTSGSPTPSGPPPIHPQLLRVRSRIGAAMIAAHALAPEQAIPFAPDPADATQFDRLRARRIVRETIPGHFWFDLVANHLHEQQAARVRAMWAVGIALVVAAIAVLFYEG